MSNYTTELRYICESLAGYTESQGYDDSYTVIAGARPHIFDFEYDLFDNEHKEELETKILSHYYTQEIGFETYGLWHFNFRRRFLELLPYYNQLYESAALEYNPLDDVNYTKLHMGSDSEQGTIQSANTGNGSSTKQNAVTDNSSSNSTTIDVNTNWNLYSDTPQGSISRIDVDGNNYLTNATKNTDNNNETYAGQNARTINTAENNSYNDSRTNATNTNNQGTNQFTETMKGKVGTYSYSKLIKDYRENILNIDLMFINEFADLFMLLW